MKADEIKRQFGKMTEEAKKLIDAGESKIAFMYGITEAALKFQIEDLTKTHMIKEEAEKAIEEIAKYKTEKAH